MARIKISPAVIGVVAMAAAGLGAFATPDGSASRDLMSRGYEAAVTPASGEHRAAADEAVDVSRDYDRAPITRGTAVQIRQRAAALEKSDQSITAKAADVRQETERQARLEEKRRTEWVLPVKGYTLTARFGQQSSLWSSGAHTGLDFAGPSGTEIVAIAAGTVESAGYEGAYGNRTVITLADGTEIWYCHQSRIVLSAGDKVSPGQLTGYTGATGNVTGPHLHVEVRPPGSEPIDPEPVLRAHGLNP